MATKKKVARKKTATKKAATRTQKKKQDIPRIKAKETNIGTKPAQQEVPPTPPQRHQLIIGYEVGPEGLPIYKGYTATDPTLTPETAMAMLELAGASIKYNDVASGEILRKIQRRAGG